MARYKPIHTGLKLLPVDFDQQVIPGSFEHALCTWSTTNLTLPNSTPLQDDDAPAFGPRPSSKSPVSLQPRYHQQSKNGTVCRENMLLIVVSGDSQPHFATLAACVSEMGEVWPACSPRCCWSVTGKD